VIVAGLSESISVGDFSQVIDLGRFIILRFDDNALKSE